MTKKDLAKRIACVSAGIIMASAAFGLAGCSEYRDDGSPYVDRFAISAKHSYILVQELDGVTLHKGSIYCVAAPNTGGKGTVPVAEVKLDCGLTLHTIAFTDYGTTKPADSKFDHVCECAQ